MSVTGASTKEQSLKTQILLELYDREKKMLEGKVRHFHTDESLSDERGIIVDPEKDEGPYRMMLHYLKEEGMINIEPTVHLAHTKGTTRVPAEVTLTAKGRDWARKMIGSIS